MEELLRKSVEVTPTGSIKFFTSKDNLEDEKLGKRDLQSRTSTRLSRATSSLSSIGHAQVIEDWINHKSLKQIQKRYSAESYKTKQMYKTVLENEETFVKEIENLINDHAMLNLRRKELQHRRWHASVYEPIRRKVEQTIEANFESVDVAKRQAYVKYLQHVNNKGDVFLDVIAEDEYDPLSLLSRDSPVRLTARTPKLADPLLSQERQRIDEHKTSLRCLTGKTFPDHLVTKQWLPSPPLVPLGRHGTQCATWLAMPLQQIESPLRKQSRKQIKGVFNQGSFDFGTWCDLTTGDQVDVEKELHLQKKKRFPIPSTFPKETHWMEFPQEKIPEQSKHHVRFSLPDKSSTNSLPPITTQT